MEPARMVSMSTNRYGLWPAVVYGQRSQGVLESRVAQRGLGFDTVGAPDIASEHKAGIHVQAERGLVLHRIRNSGRV